LTSLKINAQSRLWRVRKLYRFGWQPYVSRIFYMLLLLSGIPVDDVVNNAFPTGVTKLLPVV
jgi:hypothetical protein